MRVVADLQGARAWRVRFRRSDRKTDWCPYCAALAAAPLKARGHISNARLGAGLGVSYMRGCGCSYDIAAVNRRAKNSMSPRAPSPVPSAGPGSAPSVRALHPVEPEDELDELARRNAEAW